MRRIETCLEIAAPARRVWAVLTDFNSYGDWNPFIRRIEGKAEPGALLSVTIEPRGHSPMRFAPRVLVCEAGRELRWRGKLFLPGLFDGEHYFRLEAVGADATRFIHGETFGGLLVPLVLGRLEASIRDGFVAMNDALRQRVT